LPDWQKRWLNQLIKEFSIMQHSKDGQRILNNIKTLCQRFAPKHLDKTYSSGKTAA
jgi:hypothetical protein